MKVEDGKIVLEKNLLPMTDEEIVREYRQAKSKLGQIKILADENVCKKAVIVDILRKAGVDDLPAPYRREPKVETGAIPVISTPEPVAAPVAAPVVGTEYKVPGAKDDSGKLKLSYVPTQIIREIAKIREYGNRKYADPENWRRVAASKYHEALLRHVLAAWEHPAAVDPESGLPHLSHAACNLAFLLELMYGGAE